MPERYWIGAAAARRRQGILNAGLASIGIGPQGRNHGLNFEAEDERAAAEAARWCESTLRSALTTTGPGNR